MSEQHRYTPETGSFVNSRGETIDPNLKLVTDPARGETWQKWIGKTMPRSLFQEFGLVDAPGSEEWANLVEHSVVVTAAADTLARDLAARGVAVDLETTHRAAWAHDAAKRRDVVEGITREDEPKDEVFPRVLAEHGYTPEEIAAAKNTGRLPDRFIQDPAERAAAIASRTVEENIVGYVDARTRGADFMSLEQAREDSVAAKPDAAEFFNNNWKPYYDAVEQHFAAIAPGFDTSVLTAETIFATVQQDLAH